MRRMHVPSPHTFTHYRRDAATMDANGRMIPGALTTVETGVPGLFSPSGTRSIPTDMGGFELMEDTIYLEAVDDFETTRVVRAGDLFKDEDTNNVWKAQAPGNTFENPALYAVGRRVKHHIEFAVERVDPEAQHLA